MANDWLAFVGSHCTGKSTLLEAWRKESSKRMLVIQEVARGIIGRGYPMGKDAHVASYLHYVNDQLQRESEFDQAQHDLLISDRVILDTLCYARINRSLPRPSIPDVLIEMLEQIWLLEASRYTLHVYFPIEFPLVGDGLRDEDEAYRARVAEEILRMLKMHAVPFVSVTGSVGERLSRVRELVSG